MKLWVKTQFSRDAMPYIKYEYLTLIEYFKDLKYNETVVMETCFTDLYAHSLSLIQLDMGYMRIRLLISLSELLLLC
jgi:hypothetical protein